jgi:hypothetical protein
MEWTRRALFGVVLILAVAISAAAQTYQGGLRGAVRDPGGVVPGVEITLINDQTSVSRSTVTNAQGEYTFANVLPGTYTVRASLTGFKTVEQTGIRVGTQQFIILDLTLEVGSVSEEITVTGESPIIETSNASVGSSIDSKTLEALPTAGRNPFFLAVVTPSVVPSGDPQFVRQQDQTNSSLLSLAGGPRRGNNYLIEGVPITDLRNRAAIIPSMEAVDEVKVQVHTYDAEMGRTGGGVFNTTFKSGSNDWHGSALYQNRPSWGQGKFYFSRNQPKPDTYFHLGGGSFGGPVLRNRTFFWSSWEGYQTKTSRNSVLTLPTERERAGDFSQSGLTIYDPLTTTFNPATGQYERQPFPGNVIPANRLSPVALNILKYVPLPGADSKRLPRTAELIDKSNTWSGKIDHRWNDEFTTTGTYAGYHSIEPESRFFYLKSPVIGDNPGDPGEGALYRTVHVLAINNIWIPSSTSVWAFRYGFTSFADDDIPIAFDPATLGFAPSFTGLVPYAKFPVINMSGYGRADAVTGDRSPTDTTFYGHNAGVSYTRFMGSHEVKVGGEYRIIGMKLFAQGQGSGRFNFTTAFTQGPNPLASAAQTGDAFASFLLGVPASGDITVATPNDFFINYGAGYVQDNWRIKPDFTVNVGLRYEAETGLGEKENEFTVGFDRDRPFPVQVPGLSLKGGLMYAGVDGYPTYQADPSSAKVAPRGGFAWSINPDTVLRGGYGIFWAPPQYPFPNESRLGTRGYTAVTSYFASADGGLTPAGTLTNPFPNGIEQPKGNATGLLTGAGGDVDFVDQFSKPAYIHQFSVDVQRQLRGNMAVTVGYIGSRGENLMVGGTNPATVNINQLDPKYQAMGTALLASVPNPFFGNAAFGALSRTAAISAGQLLRPYPQFLNVRAHRMSGAKSRYHSMVVKVDRRIRNGWGFSANYTLSNLKDNQFGETNYFASNTATALDNYDIEREYTTSLLDAPHRVNFAATYELPFGQGKKWLNRGGLTHALLGGWQVSVVGSYQSGFPAQVYQNNNNSGLFGSGQRPNVVSGAAKETSGSTEDRLLTWFNPAAWTAAAPYTFGDAPRTNPDVRTPVKKQTDFAIQKTQPLGGANVMVRLEVINLFDDPNFLGPASAFGRSDFGQVSEVGGFPRMVQLLFRVNW